MARHGARVVALTVALTGALTAGGGAVAAGEEPPVVDIESAPASSWLGEHYYGVFRGDAHVGWLRRSLERVERDGRPAVVRSIETFVSIAGDGNARRSTERAVYELGGRQLLVELERRVESQGRVGGRRATRHGDRFDVVTTRDGKETKGAVTAIDVMLADELVTERTVAAARERAAGPVGAIGTALALDLGRMRALKRIVSVRGTETAPGGAVLYLVAVATGPETWSEPAAVDAHGALVRGAIGDGLSIRRMAEAEAVGDLALISVEEADRIPMAVRLGDVLTLRELEVSMPAPADGAPPPFPTTGRQRTETADGRLHLRVYVDRDAGKVTPEERAAALAPQPELGIDSGERAVVAAADRILIGTSRPAVRVVRLLAFTASHLRDAVVMDEPSASQLLILRRGDCTEHARLFIALSRAAGIPAREVTGVTWMGDEQGAFGWHAWAEVELAGRWRPVDPTEGITPAHAAHIRIDPAARAAGVLSGVRFELHAAVR